jgi:2-keto-4-pentenoate hydratase/2-oxohepta-3-ene-1,7-dioic acid hydratase in catechol pathway
VIFKKTKLEGMRIMKLVKFKYNENVRVGFLNEDKVVDINNLMNETNVTITSLIESGLSYIKEIENRFTETNQVTSYSLDEVALLAPIENPGKVVCVGNNYMDHCREQNVEPPKKPMIFSKWASCIIGPEEAIILPEESSQVDYEAELGVVLQKGGKFIQQNEVKEHIFGYVIVNDISARDVQFADVQWVRGKSFDTFAPCGPYLVTADEIIDPQNLTIKTYKNGVILQDSNTKEMIFDIPYIISYLSQGFTFDAGDLIATGTPHGVGVFRNPQVFLEDGDEITVEIEGLGVLKNKCVLEKTLAVNLK